MATAPKGWQPTPEELKAIQENGSARDKAALEKGQFAQTYNQSIANHGVRAGATQVPDPKKPPPKATAAPTGDTVTVFTGLCDALNEFQEFLVFSKTVEYPDKYVIKFAPATIGDATVAIDGQAYKASPSQKNNAQSLDPKTNKMDTTGRIVQVAAGTQVVSFIDQVMRQSSFITDQSNIVINETTGAPQFKDKPKETDTILWYKINFQAKQLQKDSIRNDYAYELTYTITPYQISQMESQYFPKTKYRGVHKSYNYWFTGKNAAILNFEQEYDNTFYTILTSWDAKKGVGTGGGGIPAGVTNVIAPASRLANNNVALSASQANVSASGSNSTISKSYAPAASVSNQGAANSANEIGASAADWLYAPIKNGTSTLRIVGDPAWIQQGEITNGISASTITFSPFLPDGTINFDAGDIMFDLYFNRPADYNFDTGLVDVSKPADSPAGTISAQQPQAHLTYRASQVKSFFNQGKFEQEIKGVFFAEQFDAIAKQTADAQAAAQAEKEIQNRPPQPSKGAPVPTKVAPQPYAGQTYLNATEMKESQDWFNKYGKTHNSDGTPIVATKTSTDSPSAPWYSKVGNAVFNPSNNPGLYVTAPSLAIKKINSLINPSNKSQQSAPKDE